MQLKKNILVTGAAGFIGAALVKRLLENNENVIGIDNLNEYYEISLKKDRLLYLEKISSKLKSNWNFCKVDLENKSNLLSKD